jgi:hypothetical protein
MFAPLLGSPVVSVAHILLLPSVGSQVNPSIATR